jgi:hypothetical protein
MRHRLAVSYHTKRQGSEGSQAVCGQDMARSVVRLRLTPIPIHVPPNRHT